MKNLIAMSAGLLMASTSAFAQPMSSGRAEIMSSVPTNSVTVADWYKQNVYDHSDNKIGEIMDVLVDREGKVSALIYVGDAMEENADELANLAGQLGLLSVPVFLFQEGYDGAARVCFNDLAKLTGGATCRFGQGSAAQLRELLEAVAVYASGGRSALADYAKGRAAPTLLLEQMP